MTRGIISYQIVSRRILHRKWRSVKDIEHVKSRWCLGSERLNSFAVNSGLSNFCLGTPYDMSFDGDEDQINRFYEWMRSVFGLDSEFSMENIHKVQDKAREKDFLFTNFNYYLV